MKILGGITRQAFLNEYWQKKPLLIRQAFADYESPISPDELAGLACEDYIQSRLVLEQGEDGPWELRHGPFSDDDFTRLPETHWTLLVQAVDHYVPEITCLLDEFDFIPNWRVDDVMISFASEQGSVGPHLDSYDVFLLQSYGRRHWQINQDSYSEDDFIAGPELRILAEFEAEQDWILEPGDMLYLPPGVAHHGVALEDCMTISIGFRAPSQKELLSAYTHHCNEFAKPRYYTDPDLELQESIGEITAKQIRDVRRLLLSAISDDAAFSNWFGRFITENPADCGEYQAEDISEEEFQQQFEQDGHLNRSGNIRMSYIEEDETISFFYAGNQLSLAYEQRELISYLCANHYLDYAAIMELTDDACVIKLLHRLYSEGCLFFDE